MSITSLLFVTEGGSDAVGATVGGGLFGLMTKPRSALASETGVGELVAGDSVGELVTGEAVGELLTGALVMTGATGATGDFDGGLLGGLGGAGMEFIVKYTKFPSDL